jgi:hypothetical protein
MKIPPMPVTLRTQFSDVGRLAQGNVDGAADREFTRVDASSLMPRTHGLDGREPYMFRLSNRDIIRHASDKRDAKANGSAIALPFAAFARAEDYFLPFDAGV